MGTWRRISEGRVFPIIPVILILLAGLVMVGVVAFIPTRSPQSQKEELPLVNVEVEAVRSVAEVADTFDLPGVVEPERVVKVSAEVASRIEGILRIEGEKVEERDPIVELNTDFYLAEFKRAKVQAEFDERESKRIASLTERGISNETDQDNARTRAEMSQAAFEVAKAELERTTIASPISGVLNRIPVEVGEYVEKGTLVAEIVDMDTVKIVIDVPERDIHFLKMGSEQEIFIDSLDDRKCSGRIAYMSELAEENTRTTRVEITVDNRERLLRSGQIVRVRLVRRILKDALLIPLEAVIPFEDGRAVYVLEKGLAQRREVELGFIKGSLVHVIRGLRAGDSLIVAGQRYVGPGQRVNVVGGE